MQVVEVVDRGSDTAVGWDTPLVDAAGGMVVLLDMVDCSACVESVSLVESAVLWSDSHMSDIRSCDLPEEVVLELGQNLDL